METRDLQKHKIFDPLNKSIPIKEERLILSNGNQEIIHDILKEQKKTNKKMKELEGIIFSKEQEISDLKKKLEKTMNTINCLHQTINGLNKHIGDPANFKQDSTQLTNNENEKTEFTILKDENERLKIENLKLQEQNSFETIFKIEELTNKINELAKQIEEKDIFIDAKERKISELDQEIKVLRENTKKIQDYEIKTFKDEPKKKQILKVSIENGAELNKNRTMETIKLKEFETTESTKNKNIMLEFEKKHSEIENLIKANNNLKEFEDLIREKKEFEKDQLIKLKDLVITRQAIAEGSFGTLYLAKRKRKKSQIYAIKTVSTLTKNVEEIENEIKIWEGFQMTKTPKSLAKFHSFEREEFNSQTRKSIEYHLIFDYYKKSLKNVIDDLSTEKENRILFSLRTLIKFSKDLIQTFAFLQTSNVCHRDLKPDNLLVDEKCDNIFVIDFGESKQANSCNTTDFKTLVGTPLYLSPELFRVFKKTDCDLKRINFFKSDVFALGLVLLELGTLKLPKRSDDMEKYAANIEKLIDEFMENYKETAEKENLEAELEELEEILRICLTVNRKERFDFFQLFIHILKIDWKKDRNRDKFREIITVWDHDSEYTKE